MRGTLAYELATLPIYWWKVFRVDTSALQVQKIPFGSHSRQYYLHAKPSQTTQRSIVIYLHGGGWWLGKPEQFVQNAMFFAQQGYEIFLPSYRRVPSYNILDIRDDLVATMKSIRDKYADRQLPRLILAGMSAGGHLASLLALDPTLLEAAGWPKDHIQGLISWCSPLDLDHTDKSLPQYWLCRKLTDSNRHIANPKALLSRSKVNFPIALIHGTKDGMVNQKNTKTFIAACQQHGLELHESQLKSTHLEIATWSLPQSDYWELSRTLLNQAKIT